jgi:hypothetical protein
MFSFRQFLDRAKLRKVAKNLFGTCSYCHRQVKTVVIKDKPRICYNCYKKVYCHKPDQSIIFTKYSGVEK